jgi:hypothetical protein
VVLSVLAAACGGVEREANLRAAGERTTATGSFRGEITVAGVDEDTGERVDGLVRRIQLEERSITTAIELFDFGAALEIAPPPADEVVEEPEPQAGP